MLFFGELFYTDDPALIIHFSPLPLIQYAHLALKWHFCGVGTAFVRGGFSSSSQCRGESVATAAGSQTPGPTLALSPPVLSLPFPYLLPSPPS